MIQFRKSLFYIHTAAALDTFKTGFGFLVTRSIKMRPSAILSMLFMPKPRHILDTLNAVLWLRCSVFSLQISLRSKNYFVKFKMN